MFSFFKKKPPVAVAPPARDMRDFGLDQPEREILIAPEFIPQAAIEAALAETQAKEKWVSRLKQSLARTGSNIASVFGVSQVDESVCEGL